MFNEIKILGKETIIYGISTVFARFFNFILLPLYTYYLTPDSYGITATVFSIIAFLNVIYGFGLNHGYMRYYKQNGSLSMTITFVFLSSFILSFILILLSKPIAGIFQFSNEYQLFIYASIILYFDSLAIIPLTDLRMQHKAYSFVFIKIFSIVLNIILNIIFLKYLKMDIDGIFLANIISSFSQMVFLSRYFKYIDFKFDKKLFKEIVNYSLPYIPSSLSYVIVQLIDRPIMMMLISSYYVGIYQANFRLSIFINLIVAMFDFAFRPFVMEKFEKQNAKELFKKVFEYFSFITLFLWVLMSLFIEDFVKISIYGIYFINPNYWIGLGIVPIVMMGYVFNGLYLNFMIGLMITKKTKYIMIANLLSAIISILLNFILVPKYGIYGSAYSILISYIFLSIFTFHINRKFYPIDYNIYKFLNIFLFSVIIYGITQIPQIKNECSYFQIKIFVFIIYAFISIKIYFSKQEIEKLKNFKNLLKS